MRDQGNKLGEIKEDGKRKSSWPWPWLWFGFEGRGSIDDQTEEQDGNVLRSEDSHSLALGAHTAAVGEDEGRGKELAPTFLEFRLDSNQMQRSTQKHRTKSLRELWRKGPSAQPTNRRLILPPARQYY